MATQKINGVYHVSNTQQGGGGGSDPEAVKYTPQTLTEAQKSQARTNIGAADEINGITSATASVDNTTGTPSVSVNLSNQQLSLAFSGLKGGQGNTGSSVDYPYELVNNVTTDDATKGLSAAQGVVLQGELDQLGQEVNGKVYDGAFNITSTGEHSSNRDRITFATPIPAGTYKYLIEAGDTGNAGGVALFVIYAGTTGNVYVGGGPIGTVGEITFASPVISMGAYMEASTNVGTGNMPLHIYKDGSLSEKINQIADFTIITQSNATLPNFNDASRTLDFGADPVFYCRGKYYTPSTIWTSDPSKYRAIQWPLATSVGSAIILVFNSENCTFSFKRYDSVLTSNECVVGGVRLNYNTSNIVAAAVPFPYTINSEPLGKDAEARQGRRCTLIATDTSSITLPNLQTDTRVLTFTGDCGLFIGSNIWSITNKSIAFPKSATAYKLWFDTNTNTFEVTNHAGTFASGSKVLVGGIRFSADGSIYADFPFDITFNGDPTTAGRLYRRGLTKYEYDGLISIKNKYAVANLLYFTSVTPPSTSASAQGMGLYGGYVVQLFNGGICAIYELSSKAKKGEFSLASASSENHSNSLTWGEKMASDIFPLAYISEANGSRRCFVERIANDFASSALVQTISFVGTSPANLGCNWAVDYQNRKLYLEFCTNSYDVEIKVFNLPDTSLGSVSLGDSDIIDSFTINVGIITQGITIHNGIIYLLFGMSESASPNTLMCVDSRSHDITATVDLSASIPTEIEDISIYDGYVVISCVAPRLYYLDFTN